MEATSEFTNERRGVIVSRYVTAQFPPSKVEDALRTYLYLKGQDVLMDPVQNFHAETFEKVLFPELPLFVPPAGQDELVLLEPDISLGKEAVQVPLLAPKWQTKRKYSPRPKEFRYTSTNVVAGAALSALPLGVRDPHKVFCSDCLEVCMSHLGCNCARGSTGGIRPYTGQSLTSSFLKKALQVLDENEEGFSPPSITECNVSCLCPKLCGNRVLQNGVQMRFEVLFNRGFCVRNVDVVAKGCFLFELCGELLTQDEARDRVHFGSDITKMVHMGAANGEIFFLDYGDYGNLGRFLVKGSKEDANVIAVRVYVEPFAYSFHHLGIFSSGKLPPRTTLVVYLPDVVFEDLMPPKDFAESVDPLPPKRTAGKSPVKNIKEGKSQMMKKNVPKAKNTKVSPGKMYVADECQVVNPRGIKSGDRKLKGKKEESPPKPYKKYSKRGRGGR